MVNRLLAVLRIASLGALITVASAGSSARAGVIWGVNGHPLTSYPGTPIARQLAYIHDLGLKSYRVDVREGDVERLPALVAAAKAEGITILPVLTPTLDLDGSNPEALYKNAFAFASGVVGRLKGDVRVFELGNELENYAIIKPCEMQDDGVQYPCGYGPAGGARALDYFGPRWRKVSAVLKGLSEGATQADPAASKAMGTAGWGHTGAFERMQSDGIAWDISVWHLYGSDPEPSLRALARYGHPIWITEFNQPLGSTESESTQAAGLARWMRRIDELAGRYHIEAAHIYELLDEPYWAGFESAMGLVTVVGNNGSGWLPGGEKAAYAAVRSHVRVAEADAGGAARTSAQTSTVAAEGATDVVPAKRRCDLSSFDSIRAPVQVDRLTYLYCLVLGRRPDGAGLHGFQDEVRAGHSLQDVAVEMLFSDEFASRNPAISGSPAMFVALVHRLLLERSAEPAFTDNAAPRIQRGSLSRAHLVRYIIDSPEFKDRHGNILGQRPLTHPAHIIAPEEGPGEALRVCDLADMARAPATAQARVAYGYCLILGRSPDSGGSRDFTAAVNAGTTIPGFLKALAGSEEFRNRYSLHIATDRQFVTSLYRLLLDREPDSGGLDGFLEVLRRGGTDRAGIAAAIIDSAEFKGHHTLLFVGG